MRSGVAVVAAVLALRIATHAQPTSHRAQRDHYDPFEIDAAAAAGIWPGDARSQDTVVRDNTPNTTLEAQLFAGYAIDRRLNPYYVHADFDRDGRMDVAFSVRDNASGQTGIAIIRAALDSVLMYGAGRGYPDSRTRGLADELVVTEEANSPPTLSVRFSDGPGLVVRWSGGTFAATTSGASTTSAAGAAGIGSEPPLLSRARQLGIIPSRDTLEVIRRWNPYYVTGDFDGDRLMDLACLVRLPQSDRHAVAIVHGALDSLRLVHDSVGFSLLRPIPKGRTLTPFPLDGLDSEALRPRVLQTDAIEVGYRGPYAAALVWRTGKYVLVTTGD